MNFYTQQHKHYCGIDLHAKAVYVRLLGQSNTILVHKNLPTTPEAFFRVIAPSRKDLIVAVGVYIHLELAGGPVSAGRDCLRVGYALYMKAIHGGKAKNEKIDSHKSAVLLRGRLFPQAYVYPAEMRATRDGRPGQPK